MTDSVQLNRFCYKYKIHVARLSFYSCANRCRCFHLSECTKTRHPYHLGLRPLKVVDWICKLFGGRRRRNSQANAHNTNFEAQANQYESHERERRTIILGLKHAAVRYQGNHYDFSKNGKVAINRTSENFSSTKWKWEKRGSSYCTLEELDKFNEGDHGEYRLVTNNCQDYVFALMKKLDECDCY